MAQLRSLDLFSGIGGITLALEGIASPLMYCDIDASARRVLRANMERGLLPVAPVAEDVRAIGAASHPDLVGQVDLIVAGFPCQGFSSYGRRGGLKDPRSGLFSEVVRLAREFDAKAIFLENVPGVLNMALTDVRELLHEAGYAIAWTVVAAADVGAPHVRKRFFGLAFKEQAELPLRFDNPGIVGPWAEGAEPPRTEAAQAAGGLTTNQRMHLLGNSVVPAAVRRAFVYLASGCREERAREASVEGVLAPGRFEERRACREGAPPPTTGLGLGDGSTYALPAPAQYVAPLAQELVFDPMAYEPHRREGRENLLAEPVRTRRWSTPRYGNILPSRVLTNRSVRDLPTQILFEVGTANRDLPISARFVEHVMGYPDNWTSF